MFHGACLPSSHAPKDVPHETDHPEVLGKKEAHSSKTGPPTKGGGTMKNSPRKKQKTETKQAALSSDAGRVKKSGKDKAWDKKRVHVATTSSKKKVLREYPIEKGRKKKGYIGSESSKETEHLKQRELRRIAKSHPDGSREKKTGFLTD